MKHVVDYIKFLCVFLAPITIWVFGGQFVAGVFFPLVYAEHPASVPLIMFSGYVIGSLAIGTMLKIIDSIKLKKSKEKISDL